MVDRNIGHIRDSLPPFKEVETSLVAAFERVITDNKAKKFREGTISLSKCIPMFARRVYKIARHGPDFTLKAKRLSKVLGTETEGWKAAIAEQSARRAYNQRKNSTPRQAKQQIADFKSALSELRTAFAALQKPALEALSNVAPWAFGKTEIELESYILILSILLEDIELPHLPKTAGTGRPKKERGYRVTEEVAKYYTALTEREPTLTVDALTSKAGGVFFVLLCEVFTILQIDESAEAKARDFIEARNQANPENQPDKGENSPEKAA